MQKHLVPVIDKGVFHNYVHMCKQLFLRDVMYIDFSPFYKRLEKRKLMKDKRKEHGAVDEPSLK